MSHQPFELWIFQDEDLSAEQRRTLQAHLDECSRCRGLYASWEGARSELADAEMIGPDPGFQARWRLRHAEQRRQAAKRQISWTLGLTILAAGVVAVPLGLQILSILEAPAAVGGSVIRDILEIDLTLKLAGGFVRALLGEVTSRLAPAGWAGIGIALSASTAIWMLSLYRFAFQPVERGGTS